MDEIAVGNHTIGQDAALRGDFLFCDFRLFVRMDREKRLLESDTAERLHVADSLYIMEYIADGRSSVVGLLPYKKLLPAFKYSGMTPWQVVVRSYGLDMKFPIDVPLWYVRDLFLLFLLAPLLIWIIRSLPLWFTPLLLVAATFFMKDCSVIFFSFGLFCRYWDIDLRPLSKWWPLFVGAPLGYFITAEFTGVNWPLMLWISVPFYTGVAILLQRLPNHLQKHMIHFGEYSFWIYCSHAPVATTLTRLGHSLNYLGMPPVLWIGLNCVVTVSIIVSCLWIMRRIMPGFVALLCGSRFPIHSHKKSSADDEGNHDPNGTQTA